jgi:hypothetical protein
MADLNEAQDGDKNEASLLKSAKNWSHKCPNNINVKLFKKYICVYFELCHHAWLYSARRFGVRVKRLFYD